MSTIRLSAVDIALVVGYLVGITILGVWLGREIRGGRDFFLAGKSLPWWAAGMSLVVSDIGAKDMIGLAGDGYRYGIVMMNFDFIGCIFPVLIAAFLFMPYFWLAGVYTVPEYLGRRYNLGVRTFFAVIWVLFMMGTLGTIFVSAAAMFEGLLGWSFWFSVMLTAVIVGLCTALGGLRAVVFTESISCIVLTAGAALICGLGLAKVDGWAHLQETIGQMTWTQHHLTLLPPADHPVYPWPAVLLGLGFVLGPAYWIGNQAIVQRTLGTRTQNEARASYVFCAAIKLVFPILLVVPGLVGVALLGPELGQPGKDWDGNRVLPMLVVRLLPPGVLGVVMGAFFAGVISNLDSYVSSASTMVVTDLYRTFIRRQAADRECLLVGRWLVVAFLVGGVAISYPIKKGFGSVFEAFQTFLSFFQGPLLALLLLGMLTRHATPWGGVAGMIIGVSTSAVLNSAELLLGVPGGIPFLWTAWWSFVAALAGVVVVSAFTSGHDEARLRGLVCWLPAEGGNKP
ncbi:MAG: sodium/solute symporter [Verrucomicrobia bacterium]|jgi:SSS family solute:Na+ symporter|nr:sodium/solute symporter [Verrucomicrobiota bacterium]OQC66265.1 MAG: Sodium/glucose cotransporter [Verrucomicrobia bacterium ADurb.Bin006]MDI9380344.1 sodium/solute symporter [Verrucomicrobiota bacterium]NMD18773.1 sodium/solute symporter [Verrucomicrobiota bacterium]HOA60667.1 sodium/solute symporter [Verrucomicrobiota bacterium]